MNRIIQWLTKPPVEGSRYILLIRLMTGCVFLWEGIIKFVFENQGVGRFTKIGIPFPEFSANFVGCLEIIGGVLIICGLFTRIITILFIIQMIVAILSTKIAILLGNSPLALPPVPPQIGFWAVLHEIRSDYAQIMTSIFLLIIGPGKWSIDAIMDRFRIAKHDN